MSILLLNKYFSNFKIDKNREILMIGHSHSECAFNDFLIPGLANFSQSGESYFYSYIKAKELIAQNPNINTLLIEFSNNQIDKHMGEWIWGDKYMSYRFPKYAQFMDLESLNLLIDNNPKCFEENIFPLIKNNFKMIVKGLDYKNEIGGYLYLKRNKTDSLVQDLSKKKETNNSITQVSYENLEFLQKIITYAEHQGIKVYLVRSPLHEKYTGFQNEQIFQDILNTKFSNIEFLDFSHFPLSNSEFGDLEHVNHKGATIFSNWFAGLLEKGLLEKFNKQSFINEEIKARENLEHKGKS